VRDALALLDAGISFVPAGLQSKRPQVAEWRLYQIRRPTTSEVARWFSCQDCAQEGDVAIAVVAGDVSGGLECLDFSCEAVAFGPWRDTVARSAPGLFERLVVVGTKSDGRHVLYRCPGQVCGSQPIARHQRVTVDGEAYYHGKVGRDRKTDAGWAFFTVIETRGEGAYFLTAPSQGYEVLQGKVTEPPIITPEERAILVACGREQCDEWNVAELRKTDDELHAEMAARPPRALASTSPIDAYNHQLGVAEVVVNELKAIGWEQTHEDANQYYLAWADPRSGRKASAMLRKRDGLLHSLGKGVSKFGESGCLTPARVYAVIHHNGNMSAAAKALRLCGFGSGDGNVS
jgi:hypothetical protein